MPLISATRETPNGPAPIPRMPVRRPLWQPWGWCFLCLLGWGLALAAAPTVLRVWAVECASNG